MEETQTAIAAAKEAGKLLLERFDQLHTVTVKGPHDIVTEADTEAERAILDMLKERFPDYSLLSEDAGKSGEGERMWIVDPLDGTTNYSIRNPFFDVSIALAERSAGVWRVISGVVHAPITSDMFFAEKGEGCFLNGERVSVSREAELDKLLIAYCHGTVEKEMRRVGKLFVPLKTACRDLNRMRAGALELAFVACGRLGAYLSAGGKPWDAAAGQLLVTEAGGKVTDFSGGTWDVNAQEADIMATNGAVHEKLLAIIEAAAEQ